MSSLRHAREAQVGGVFCRPSLDQMSLVDAGLAPSTHTGRPQPHSLLPTPAGSRDASRGGQAAHGPGGDPPTDSDYVSAGFVATPLWRHTVSSAQDRSRGEHVILRSELVGP